MTVRARLTVTGLAVWLISTLFVGGVVLYRMATSDPAGVALARSALWAGAVVSLPVAVLVTWVRSRHLVSAVQVMHEMVKGMVSGKFRERFFPVTRTEADEIGADLNSLATDLHARTHDLQDSKAKLGATFDASVSGIAIFASDGTVSAINRAGQDILRRSGRELIGLPFPMALASSDLSSLVYNALYHSKRGRKEVHLGRSPENIVDATAVPLMTDTENAGGQASGVVLTMHDMTEVRRLERMRTDFVQNVSHELRTPVTIVQGFAETLRDTPPTDTGAVSEMADLIYQEASRLTDLVTGLLDLAKFESGSATAVKEALDPGDFLKRVVRKMETLAGRRSQTIQVETGAAQGASLSADPALLDTILTNLLGNAVKYTDEGGRIEAGVKPDKDGWLIWVKDSGPGIGAEDLPRIFERFYRGAKDRSRSTGGSGLGLAIVKHCVSLHSGKVWAESQEGKGATFYVWLP